MAKFVHTEIPNDCLKRKIAEVSEFDILVRSLKTCVNQLSNAVSQLQTAPLTLLKDLEKMSTNDSSIGALMTWLSNNLNFCDFQLTHIPSLEGLMVLIQQVHSRIVATGDAIGARNTAWAAKVISDQQSNKRGLSKQEKAARMKSNHSVEEIFNKSTQEATLSINSLLSEKGSIIAAALDRLCDCYADILKLSRKLPREPEQTNEILHFMTVELGKTYVRGRDDVQVELLKTYKCEKDDTRTKNAVMVCTEDPNVLHSINGDHEIKSAEAPADLQSIDSKLSMQGKMDMNQQLPPQPPLFTIPKLRRKASLSGFSEGERVRLWSDTEHEWLQGIVKNVFCASGSWDNFAVPTGVIQVDSNVGTKFIQREQLNCLQKAYTPKAVCEPEQIICLRKSVSSQAMCEEIYSI